MATQILKYARLFLVLGVCVFAAAMLVVAPIELYGVQSVRHWQPVKARLIDAGFRAAAFDPGETYAYFTVHALATGRDIEIHDVRPGDFPFQVHFLGLVVFDSASAVMKNYAGRGEVTVWCAPDGRKCVLEQGHYGLMTTLLVLPLAWWGWVIVARRTRNRADFL